MVVPSRTYLPTLFNADQLGMTARYQQHQIRRTQPFRQPRRKRVTFQMIYRVERLAGSHRNRLGRHQSGQHATDQPGPAVTAMASSPSNPVPGCAMAS
jgi:hypothetical protein